MAKSAPDTPMSTRDLGALQRGLLSLVMSDLKAKAEAYFSVVTWKGIVHVLLTDGTASMIIYRLMQWCHRRRLNWLAMFFNKLNLLVGRCVIGRGADFGPEFVLRHSIGVVINTNVVGGRGIHIEHQVTIGAEKGANPSLGDHVFVGAGAKIIGAVRVGSYARIGANAVVVHDVADGDTVVGVPARVVRSRGHA